MSLVISMLITVMLVMNLITTISIKNDDVKGLRGSSDVKRLKNSYDENLNRYSFKITGDINRNTKEYHQNKLKEFIEYNLSRAEYFRKYELDNNELQCGTDVCMCYEERYMKFLSKKYNIDIKLINELISSAEYAEKEYQNLKLKSYLINGNAHNKTKDYYNEPIVNLKVGGLL